MNMLEYIFDQEADVDIEQLEDLTETQLRKTEEKLDVRLPASYVKLMNMRNGGTLAYSELHAKKLPDGEMLVDAIMGIAPDDGIGESPDLAEEWEVEAGFVLFAGDGHEWLAFDYRDGPTDDPEIFYVPTDGGKPKRVAKTFEKFVKKLRKPEEIEMDVDEEDDEDSDRVYTKSEVEQLIQEGESLFDMSAGLEQFAKEEGNMDWFLKQCFRTLGIGEIEDIAWAVGEAVLIKLKTEPEENWPIAELQKMADHLKHGVDEYGAPDGIARRLGKRMQRKIKDVDD